jgi:hypothetical protein
VRPYRGIPIFDGGTLVQHYLRPEEMRPFHSQVLGCLAEAAAACGPGAGSSSSQSKQEEGQHSQHSQQQQQEKGEEGGHSRHPQQQQQQQQQQQPAEQEEGKEGRGVMPDRPGGHPSPAHELYAMLVDLQLLRR